MDEKEEDCEKSSISDLRRSHVIILKIYVIEIEIFVLLFFLKPVHC
jgi:hypothetical protein